MKKKHDSRRLIISRFLLAVYLILLSVGSVHVHQAQAELSCMDCYEHVHHDGHFSQWAMNHNDCLICQLLHELFVNPQALVFSAIVFATFTFILSAPDFTVSRRVCLPGLRAPPIYGWYNYYQLITEESYTSEHLQWTKNELSVPYCLYSVLSRCFAPILLTVSRMCSYRKSLSPASADSATR